MAQTAGFRFAINGPWSSGQSSRAQTYEALNLSEIVRIAKLVQLQPFKTSHINQIITRYTIYNYTKTKNLEIKEPNEKSTCPLNIIL